MNSEMIHTPHNRIHGGTDALVLPLFDFSTNSNACGPCPTTQSAIAQADATRYPDPSYAVLRDKLAAFHGCEANRIVIAGSASEFIFRITALAKMQGVSSVYVPLHSFGDYAHAAQAWGLPLAIDAKDAGLAWHCQPSSPLGQVDTDTVEVSSKAIHVLDLAYAPLQLTDKKEVSEGRHNSVWQLYSPNKALGLTGVRAAYAIAPLGSDQLVRQLAGLSASWPLGAHGVALLESWVSPDVQTWLANSLQTLQIWKMRQVTMLESLGWTCQPSVTNFFCATPRLTNGLTLGGALAAMRKQGSKQGIKLRDTSSFGLPGQVRVSVQPPVAQDALRDAWQLIHKDNQ
jgi:histidinol-phosphate aminotransferase